jgi:hypothetical protein
MAATDSDATIEELLEAAFSMWSVPRLYNEEQLRLRECLETAVRRVECWCEMAAILGVSGLVREQLRFGHCDLLLVEAGS